MSVRDKQPDEIRRDTVTLTEDLRQIESEIRLFGLYRQLWHILDGAARFILAGVGGFIAWFLLDWRFTLPDWPLYVGFIAACALFLFSLAWWFLPRFARRITVDHEALVIEQLHGRLDNELIGSLQLARDVVSAGQAGVQLYYSVSLVRQLVRRAAAKIAAMHPRSMLDLRAARRRVLSAVVVAAVAAACLILAGEAVRERWTRLVNAQSTVLETLFPVELVVEPGNHILLKGSPFDVRVTARGARHRNISLVIQDTRTRMESVIPLSLTDRCAAHTITKTDASFRYRFVYGKLESPTFDVLVGERPAIQAISYELSAPPYTGTPPRLLTGRQPRLHAIRGTSVMISFAATTTLHPEMCGVDWQNSPRQPITVNGRYGHFFFVIGQTDRASIRLTGQYGAGFEMEQSVSFDLVVRDDERPTAQILYPPPDNTKYLLLPEEVVGLSPRCQGEDDFGVSELKFQYTVRKYDKDLQKGEPRDNDVPHRIVPPRDRVVETYKDVFAALSPAPVPGDVFLITAVATDNNTETGPGVGRSQPVEIVVVAQDPGRFAAGDASFGNARRNSGSAGFDFGKALTTSQRSTPYLRMPQKEVVTEDKVKVSRQIVNTQVKTDRLSGGAEQQYGEYTERLMKESKP